MLVREIMERAGVPTFGLARMFITDALTEMALLTESFVSESSFSLYAGSRHYNLPNEVVRVSDVLIKNHMNNKGEFRSIPRLINKPKIKDVDEYNINPNMPPLLPEINVQQNSGASGGNDSKAREYAYYYEGNKLAIVEKEHYSASTGNVVDDINAYQKATSDWVSPTIDANNYIQVRYTRAPIVDIRPTTSYKWVGKIVPNENAGDSNAEITIFVSNWEFDANSDGDILASDHYFNLTSGPWAVAGNYVYIANQDAFNGLWEVTSVGGDQNYHLQLKRTAQDQTTKMDGTNMGTGYGAGVYSNSIGVVYPPGDVKSLLGDQEAYYVPLSATESQAVICYIKGAVAEQQGDLERKLYYQKEFEKKLEKQRTARYPGPRMISSGPFALK
tara:strand:+ start:1223 stop:2386 length:1164 start_codon:yes stop_codon:yes gene_type:complete